MNEFTYNASALGAGGVFRNGAITTVIPSIASVALAPTGGEGKTIVSNYFSEELSFSHAETRVNGYVNAGTHVTQTYVYITGLRVFDKLEIDELKGTVTSIHSDLDDDHEFTLEATYKNVRALGHQVVPIDDVCVKSLKRYKDLQAVVQKLKGNEGVTLDADVTLPNDGDELAERFGADINSLEQSINQGRALQGTLVEKVVGDVFPSNAAARRHHKVYIEGLGTVRFGELLLKPGRRRVNLLRIAFTNELVNTEAPGPDGGALTIASVEGNGTPVFP